MALRAEDELAIRRLLAAYAQAVGRGDVEGWVALFTHDAVWERAKPAAGSVYNVAVRHEGRESLRELASSSFAEQGTVQYVSANAIIDGDGDEAAGTSTIFVIKMQDAEPSLLVVGNFADKYVRTTDGWRFRERVIRLLS
jgi:ketosteroid isomerase-like protein